MNNITVVGLVATTPRQVVTEDGTQIVSFRLASQRSGISQVNDEEYETTNWFTVSIFGNLAKNAGLSIEKGNRVIIYGDLHIRDWDNGERSGTSVEIQAESIGHDLNYGVAEFRRTPVAPETIARTHFCNCQDCEVR